MITDWLDKFKRHWVEKNLAGVRTLFTEDVEYWETPYKRIDGVDNVVDEWRAVLSQSSISIDTKVVVDDNNAHVVKWKLTYTMDGSDHSWSGLYLVRLSAEDRCYYFYQVGEKKDPRKDGNLKGKSSIGDTFSIAKTRKKVNKRTGSR